MAVRGGAPLTPDPLDRLKAALADRYRFEGTLGSGGMATVYLARDLRHNRRVAIKVLRPELAAVLGTERFLREIDITAGLHHPHIVPLYDSGEADGTVYYVMPHVEGESLRDRLRREKQLAIDEAVAIACEVAGALAYAHTRGVVHRDIKPENILLIDGQALVADFGIARALVEAGGERLTATGVTMGTPAYMSPEQTSGEPDVDGRTDVYALGCVLYETLTGEPPYTGPTAQAILSKHLTHAVPEVRRLRDRVPPYVEAAVMRALAKLRADRFATAREFAAALVAPDAPARRPTWMEVVRRTRLTTRIVLAAGILLLVLGGLYVGGLRDAVAPAGSERRSVAVLPFENVGGDSANEYFSDGLTEELIAALSQVSALRVAARTSAFAFKGQARDVREIGRALNVTTVLVGSVRKAEQRVRVTAQLIDAASGLAVWSETYEERQLADIFDIQADLALRIARALEANLTPSERGRLARKPTESLEAYTLYLKGRFAWNQRDEGLDKAIEYFKQAIAVDSQYARAYAGLAGAYGPLGVLGYIDPREGRPRMRAAAERAVALDAELAEAHTVLGAYRATYEWDWPAAEREYRRAIELDPDYPTAYLWLGFLLERLGRFDEAIPARRRFVDLDPLAPSAGIAAALLHAGRYELAETAFREAVQRHPNYWLVHEGLGEALEATGELEEAQREFARAAALAGRTSRPRAGLARVVALAGRGTEARRIIRQLRLQTDTTGIYHPVVAAALVAVGDTAAALDWLEAAHDQRHPDLVSLNVDRRYAALRPHPRFQRLLGSIGFPR